MGILDFIFPKYCVNCKKFGDYLCADCFVRLSFDTKNICLPCGRPSYNGLTHPRCLRKYCVEGSFTGIVYNSVAKKLIFQFKYKPYLTNLSTFLGNLLYESLVQNEEFGKVLRQAQDKLILVPIPLSSKKQRMRGYNQAEILAKELGKKFNLEVAGCLNRIKDTPSQVGLNKKERQENIKGAFSVNSKLKVNFKNKNIILVDDVLTSGSTFSEACKILKHSGAKKVWAIAFAKED